MIGVSVLALVSCSSTPDGGAQGAADSEAARQAYLEALDSLPGDPGRARIRLANFVRVYPGSMHAPKAAYKLAELAALQGDPADAERWLGWLLREHPRSRVEERARLKLGELQAEAGDSQEAEATLSKLRFSKLPEADRTRAYRLLAQAAVDPVRRLRWLSEWRTTASGPGAETSPADPKIDRVLDAADDASLDRAAQELPPGVVSGRVALEQAARALVLGDSGAARAALDRAEEMPLPGRYARRFEALRAELESPGSARGVAGRLPSFAELAQRGSPDTTAATGTLGIVLPLTGPFASYGEDSLRGILLAAGIFGDASSGKTAVATGSLGIASPGGVRLRVRDSGGNPQRAAAAVREFASDDEVVAILGPLLSKVAEAAAAAASEEGVPLVALTSRTSLPKQRPDVFRIKTTPDDEVNALVRHAVGDLGATRFAILYPEDGYGRGMRDRFWESVDEQGGWVVGVSSYDPDATDFKKPIQSLIGYTLLTENEKTALKERSAMLRRARRLPPEQASVVRQVAPTILGPEADPLPPVVDFDALFIPDAHEKVVLLTPQLAFHEVDEIQLLGTSGWHHAELIEIARGHVDGAVIASSFDSESRVPFVAEFSAHYREAFGSAPDAYAAHGFDAARLVLMQLAAGDDSRASVARGLLALRAYPGASGVLAFLPDGNAIKRPFLMGVRGRKFVPLD
ncbi:MAG: ABC transporter substrate-binding protein [Myxococcota bacterium]|nr:ABC transporter substrate-binding protein [Myxococcota bacterium]